MLYWAWMFYKKHTSWNIPFDKIEMMDKFTVTPIFCYHCSEGQISSRNCCSCEDSYNVLVAACLRLRRTRFATLQFPPRRSRVPETRNYSAWQPVEVNELRQSFKITFFLSNPLMPYVLPSYPVQKMLHSIITPGEQSWHPYYHTIIAFCFSQLTLISHSFLGYEWWKIWKEAEMCQAERKLPVLFSWAGVPWRHPWVWKAGLHQLTVSLRVELGL